MRAYRTWMIFKNEIKVCKVIFINFDIENVNISCNNTSSLGQLSFGNDGKVYSRLSNYENESEEYEIKSPCEIKLRTKNGEEGRILIENLTGYVKK